jgi:ribosomal protein S18 acetylase RimI-like enzyme
MSDEPWFRSAASFTLDMLANIFTRSFEQYFYQSLTTNERLAQRIRTESLDLHRSLVMLIGDEPVGQAMIGLRGGQAWCGGFGIMPSFRGRGLARQLATRMLDQARLAGARAFSLEVLTRNEPAIKTYTRAGLRTRRDLQVLEWRQAAAEPGAGVRSGAAASQEAAAQRALLVDDPERLLDRFSRLHPVPAAWQRDLPALLAGGGFQGLAIEGGDGPAAYVLFHTAADGNVRVEDLGAVRVELAHALLAALQGRSTRILSVNEPADSPLTAAFLSAGFVETDRQHEMWIDL